MEKDDFIKNETLKILEKIEFENLETDDSFYITLNIGSSLIEHAMLMLEHSSRRQMLELILNQAQQNLESYETGEYNND